MSPQTSLLPAASAAAAPTLAPISGAVATLQALVAEGADTIFGYPGGAIIPIYDALYDFKDQLNHVLVRHEQGGIHAAQGYARQTALSVYVEFAYGPKRETHQRAHLDFQYTPSSGVPATNVSAVVVNVTVLSAASSGFLQGGANQNSHTSSIRNTAPRGCSV